MSSSSLGILVDLVFRFQEPDWAGQFDVVEVWRSQLTERGPYEEVTGPAWESASVLIGGILAAPQLAPLVGRTLELLVNETVEVAVTFTGTDPVSATSIASQIQAASNGVLLATDLEDGTILVETAQPGAAATLRVVGGDAAPILGLVVGTLSYGQDPRIRLVSGQEVYEFSDPHGSNTFYYKTRFRNSSTGAVSDFSSPLTVTVIVSVNPTSLVRGVIDAVDGSGKPLVGRTVLLSFTSQYVTVDGFNVFGGEERLFTDETGHAEFYFVRGTKFRVAMAGTNLVREVTAPRDAAVTSFNMFDPAYGTDDVFKVQQPDIDFAVRRTL